MFFFFRMKTTFHWYIVCVWHAWLFKKCATHISTKKSNIYYIYNYIYKICINAIYSNETHIYVLNVFFFDNLCLIFYTFIKINYYTIYLLIVVCWAVFLLYSLKNVTNKITVSNVADELDYGCSWIPTCKMRAIWLGSRKCCLVAGYKRPLIVNWCLIRTAIWWFLRTRCVTWTLSNHYTLIFVI